jgi:hypothetical protein
MNGVATFGGERGLGYLVLQCAIRGGLPRWIVRAIPSTPAEAIAEEAAMEVAAVINSAGLRRVLTYRNSNFLDSF